MVKVVWEFRPMSVRLSELLGYVQSMISAVSWANHCPTPVPLTAVSVSPG